LTELKATLKKSPLHLSYFESLPLAFEEAKRKAEKKDLILVCGSTFAVSEILAHIKIIKDE
jgi:folylpolyglutamate synthase/dihydropteroate synthase